ncbi:MAG: BMP family lipoprotein [Bacillota bacterium]
MARNWFAKFAAVTLTLAVLAGCGGAKETAPQQAPAKQEEKKETPASAKPFTVGMATDMGGLNDDSFNAAAYRGLKRAESELKVKINVIESKRQEEYEVNFGTLMDQGSDLIWGIGFLMQEAIAKVAEQNPKQKYAIIDAVAEKPNVASVLFKEEEGSFLMGIMAAKTTKTNKVAFIGGMNIPVIHHFEAGYKAGVKAVNPNIEVITIYSDSFVDPAKGKSDALAAIGRGADVLFHAAGGTGQGVIEAAKEKNLFAIGVDSDQNHLAPDHVISSMMKRVDVAVFDVSKMAMEGKFPGGQTITLGLKENGVGYSDKTLWNKMPADTKALVDKWADAIKSGKVKVPNDMKQFETWTVPTL